MSRPRDPGPVRPDGTLPWMGMAVVALAVLLAATVLLPWVRVTIHYPPPLSVPDPSPTSTVTGIGDGPQAVWAWLTLVCAVAAGVVGVVGVVVRNGRLVGAAALPGLVALGAALTTAVGLWSAPSAYPLPGAWAKAGDAVRHLLSENLTVAPGLGLYLVVITALLVIGLGVAAFVLAGDTGHRRPRSTPAP